MQVVKLKLEENKERYYVAKDDGTPIEPIFKFIKFKDNTNYARNTLKQYCGHLKLYFEYLEQINLNFQDVNIDDLAHFVHWLQNPHQNIKVIPLKNEETPRCEATINAIINTVLTFYDYVLRHDEYSNNISEKLKKFATVPSRNFKGFLYGIAYQKQTVTSNILKLKVPKKRPKTLKKGEIQELLNSCNNYRDKFLMCLLYETGMRIGEVLSLWLEDFDINDMTINVKDRGFLENNAEIKTVSSPRRIDISQDIVDMFMEYVNNVFRKLEKKTGIYVTPHMYRHTSITTLKQAGWEPELLRVRAGHKNIYTTLNTYVHPSDEEIFKEFSRTKSIFNTPSNGGVENA